MTGSPTPALRWMLFVLFGISGFAGLIYESIWTHYLKLFLGHAAYAQTLVLAIFMGGVALGAWLAGDLAQRLRQPLLGYATVEVAIGAAALVFDPLFRGLTDWMYDSVLPGLGEPALVELVKWTASSLIILPQSVLLGMTFPLMSAALMRAVPGASGYTLATLYFTNSIGASAGVLCSGFWLIPAVGLPGTMLTAGLLNLGLALAVWLLARSTVAGDAPAATATTAMPGATVALLLATAFFTGAASFFYEIGWIRMLSLVLGAATHSFELMLSAFILGLALGSFFVRRSVDRFASPLRTLGIIQVAMALLAASTLLSYESSFDVMAWLLRGLARSDAGYMLYMLASHGLCLALMLPATICAGMTLPLITHVLYAQGQGERVIGRVYAINTLGAIAGVLAATHLVMPLLGLENVIAVGALIDLALGVVLLRRALPGWSAPVRLTLGAAVAAYAAVALFARFDPNRLSSGVFRSGTSTNPGVVEFHRDGKTASVAVTRQANLLVIATNGKPDAAYSLSPVPAADEPTMAMAGLLPLLYAPDTRRVAVVGIGSGLTSQALLTVPELERVDTIEIEPAMVEGARHFQPAVRAVFEDPRSAIHIADAKTFFARNGATYDAIVSEPSNPWVSGVASLFSREFYRHVTRYLRDDGIFVQWVQLYELDLALLQTVLRALQPHFSDYVAYLGDSSDLIIVARKTGRLPAPSPAFFARPELRETLARLRLSSPADLDLHRVAGRAGIDALVALNHGPANSDFFPVLDTGAARSRFLGSDARPLLYTLYQFERLFEPGALPPVTADERLLSPAVPTEQALLLAQQLRAWLAQAPPPVRAPDTANLEMLAAILSPGLQCDARALTRWLPSLTSFIAEWADLMPREALALLANHLARSPCRNRWPPPAQQWVGLLRAMADGDWRAMAGLALALAPQAGPAQSAVIRHALVAAVRLGDRAYLMQIASRHGDAIRGDPDLRLLVAAIEVRMRSWPSA